MPWTVKGLDEERWQTLRTVRLAALTDAPHAFWATLATEAAYTEHDWRSSLRKAAWFVAAESGRPLGIAGGVPPGEARDQPELIGLWVHPTARRHGIGSALIHAVEQWALSSGARGMTVRVVTGNDAALQLYRAAGYHPTGEQTTIPHDPDRIEVRMRRDFPTKLLTRVVAQAGRQDAITALTEMPGADLTTMLLETTRLRARRRRPVHVLRQFRGDRFVAPATVPFEQLRTAEDAVLSKLPGEFDLLTLSPVTPLGTHSSIAAVDQNNVISTVRQTEVAADPTNALALEAAVRRQRILTRSPRSADVVRLAAIQRVVRAQRFTAPLSFAHFTLFGLVSAGRDTGNLAFERQHLLEHLSVAVNAATDPVGCSVQLRLTAIEPRFATCLTAVAESFTGDSRVEVVDDPHRSTGLAYYHGLCFKILINIGTGHVEVGDGGFVSWTQALLENRKERLLISGIGIDRLAMLIERAAHGSQPDG